MTDSPGNLGSFEQDVWPLHGLVMGLLRYWSPGRNDYEDVASNIFIKAWKAWPRFEPVDPEKPAASVKAWITTIARHELINAARKTKLREASSLDELEEWRLDRIDSITALVDFDARTRMGDLSVTLRDAILSIPEAFREVVYLVVVEELSYSETSDVLGIPIGTVMSRLSRGRNALRQVLTPEDLAA